MSATRPDLCYIVTKLSQNMSKPTSDDLNLAKQVLRYIKGTISHSLCFEKSENDIRLVGFCDADWGASQDRKSITGYGFRMSDTGPLISWKSKKQQSVALSTCEAEYMALSSAVQEAKFLIQLAEDLELAGLNSVTLHVDNQGAIALAKNPVHHQRSKHIDIRYHFVRSEVQRGLINLKYVASSENIADMFTKAISKTKLSIFTNQIMNC